MNAAIEVHDLFMMFGREEVLKNINVSFEAGKIHGIIGRNGSGKTVLMKCILGFLKPARGKIVVFGKVIGRDCDFAPYTGMMIETPGFIPTESGYNNLKWLLGLSGKKNGMKVDEAMRIVGLYPGNKKHVGKYSLGMRQRLGIAQAIMENPRLMVLDEPMNGLDNSGVDDIRMIFRKMKETGVTILLASHDRSDIDILCDTVTEIDAGVITMKDIREIGSVDQC